MTTPETTPIPKEIAKILTQKRYKVRKTVFPVFSHNPSSMAR